MKTKLIAMLTLSASATCCAGYVNAAIDWNLANPAIVYTSTPTFGSVTVAGSGTGTGTSVTATAWANTGNTGVGGALNDKTYTLESAYLTPQGSSGVGIKNQDATAPLNSTGGTSGTTSCNNQPTGDCSEGASPEHAVDNQQRNDMVLFSFTNGISLTSLNIGWVGADSDITVLAYTGSGTPTLSGDTYDSLNGWKLVNHYSNAGTGNENITTSIYSSYWLIGAYNSYVGTCPTCNAITDSTSDAVKINGLGGKTCTNAPPGTPGCGSNVPEPATLGLLGLGLLGMARIRRPYKQT